MSDPIVLLASQLAPLVVLASLRIGTVLALLPAPFGSLAPVPVRAFLSVAIALAIAVPRAGEAPDVDLEALALLRAGLGEVLVGFVIGLTVRVTLAAAEVAGTFMGFSMGLGFASSIDPTFGEQSLATSRVLGSFAALIFLVLRGHHIVLSALAATLDSAPIGDAFGALAHADITNIGADMLAQALRIASPVVATMFIVQVGTGLVSKAAPRVHIFALSFAVAACAGMLTLFVAAPSVATAVTVHLGEIPERLATALGGL